MSPPSSLIGLTLGILLVLAPGAQEGADPVDRLMGEGRSSIEAGDLEEGVARWTEALALAPDRGEIIVALAQALPDDVDARWGWTHAFFAATADAQGKVELEPEAKEALVEPALAGRLARGRAQAVAELLAFAKSREKGGARDASQLFVARWARRLAASIAQEAPRLEAFHRKSLTFDLELATSFSKPVRTTLLRELKNASSRRDYGVAVRAARILRGLGAQSGFPFLRGEAPRDAADMGARAQKILDDLRDALARTLEPWSIEDLEWHASDEGEAFTRAHGSFGRPGVALSPRGLYRVETDCGHETLLETARTVELHHRRLVNWYGEDPFEGRQGTVRIVPSSTGLEGEGAGHYWVGGFQAGDETTLRFSQSDIESLGRGLTHELTHRFDGALYPGMPAWLAEGRAVWTAAAYGAMNDEEFEPRYASFSALQDTLGRGYGGAAQLRRLIEGELEDYRDNYVAGHALYVFLSTWGPEEGVPLYRERLDAFMEDPAKASRSKMFSRFVEAFADGSGGRPDGFAAFAEAFAEFLRGFHWLEPAEWNTRYVREVAAAKAPMLYDQPTLSWEWQRHEPVFGQGQARLAGELLAELGKDADAVRAFVWALSTDLRDPRIQRAAARACERLGQEDAAWVLRSEVEPNVAPAPFLRELARTKSWLAMLEEAAQQAGEAGASGASAMFEAEAQLRQHALGEAADWQGQATHDLSPFLPFDPPARALTADGVSEEELVGFDDRRLPGLWSTTDAGDILVGWEADRSFSGRVDRSAVQRDAAVFGKRWMAPGAYRLRTRVRFLTGYVSGAIVLAHGRRDRNVRFTFQAGDFQYATGITDTEPEFRTLSWKIEGLREREGVLATSLAQGVFAFGRSTPLFDVELRVDGELLEVWLDGEQVGAYSSPDGAALEGRVGFASSFGAFRAELARLERMDRARASTHTSPAVLDLRASRAPDFSGLVNRPLRGLPTRSNGRLVLWIPPPQVNRTQEAVSALARGMNRKGHPQSLVLLVPEDVPEAQREALLTAAREEWEGEASLSTHGVTASDLEQRPDGNKRWVFFVDGAGIVRYAARYLTQRAGLAKELEHWLRVFRDEGQPDRDLPEPLRRGAEVEEE